MRNIKAEAERLRIGLLGRWHTIPEIVVWADDILMSELSPPPQILDISLSRKRHPEDVAHLLDEIPGMVDRVAIIRECLVDLRRWIGDDQDRGEQAAQYLYALASAGIFPDSKFRHESFSFYNKFYFARTGDGADGTVLDVLRDLQDWLDVNAMQL
ncbi:MAG: hypothetical protein HGB17_15555 [Syntrophobacteraceae bacterium]|nr:hypothetical protein [Syntrophobacteraceae bacterium]